MSKIFRRYVPTLCTTAQKSPIGFQLASCLLKDKKMIGTACCNTTSKSECCGSVHAEANAIKTYFGKNLSFDNKSKMWYLKWGYEKYKET